MGESTYSSAGSESLNDSSLLVGLENLVNGVLALDNLELLGQARTGELDNAAAGDAVQDQLIVKRGGDELELALLGAPHQEEVAGTGLSAIVLRSVEPENLTEATLVCLKSSEQAGAVVGADLGITESANPSADHVLGVGMELHTAGLGIQTGHEADGDEKKGLLGGLNTELGLSTDHGRADVKEGASALLGEPLGAIGGAEGDDELLKLLGVKAGERDAQGGHEHALCVEVRAEEAKLAVESAEELETLEALSRIVEDGGSGHESERSIGLEFRSLPAGSNLVLGSDHVVGADGFETRVGHLLGRHLAGSRIGILEGELGSIQLGESRGAVGVSIDMSVGVAVSVAVGKGAVCCPLLEGNGGEVTVGGVGGLSHGDPLPLVVICEVKA